MALLFVNLFLSIFYWRCCILILQKGTNGWGEIVRIFDSILHFFASHYLLSACYARMTLPRIAWCLLTLVSQFHGSKTKGVLESECTTGFHFVNNEYAKWCRTIVVCLVKQRAVATKHNSIYFRNFSCAAGGRHEMWIDSIRNPPRMALKNITRWHAMQHWNCRTVCGHSHTFLSLHCVTPQL